MRFWFQLVFIGALIGFTTFLFSCKKKDPDPNLYHFSAEIDEITYYYEHDQDDNVAVAIGSEYNLVDDGYQHFEGGGVLEVNGLRGGHFIVYKTYGDSITDVITRGDGILSPGTRTYKTTDEDSDGAEVIYVDRNYVHWISSYGNGNEQSTFEIITNEYEQDGNVYYKTRAEFSCFVYTKDGSDSLRIDNGACFTSSIAAW